MTPNRARYAARRKVRRVPIGLYRELQSAGQTCLTDAELRTLAAIMEIHESAPVTFRGIASQLGVTNGANIYLAVNRLESLGLISCDRLRCGTIVPRCRWEGMP